MHARYLAPAEFADRLRIHARVVDSAARGSASNTRSSARRRDAVADGWTAMPASTRRRSGRRGCRRGWPRRSLAPRRRRRPAVGGRRLRRRRSSSCRSWSCVVVARRSSCPWSCRSWRLGGFGFGSFVPMRTSSGSATVATSTRCCRRAASRRRCRPCADVRRLRRHAGLVDDRLALRERRVGRLLDRRRPGDLERRRLALDAAVLRRAVEIDLSDDEPTYVRSSSQWPCRSRT